MEPLTIGLIAAGAAWWLAKSKKSKAAKRGPRPTITIAADCSKWDIPDPWYAQIAAPKYVQLVAQFPDSMPLETRVSRIAESILIGETGQCPAKDLPNLPGAMRGLFDHIGEYVRYGLQNGGNPFLPGLARYVVASETFQASSPTAIIVVRRPDTVDNTGGKPYAWGTGKYGVSLSTILTKLGQLDETNDDQIEGLLAHFGYADSIDAALTKARQTALLGPGDATADDAGAGAHLLS